jgi:steroid delta-isomerase-like uncharacterized protein
MDRPRALRIIRYPGTVWRLIMTRDEIDAFLARRQAAWAARDATALARDHTDDAIVESPLAGGAATGREAIEQLYATYFRAFPDLKMQWDEVLVDGDRVALFAHATGTDSGGFMGLPPTGRSISVGLVFLYELKDGRIARERRIYDFTGVLLQVGALRAKPA